MDRSPVNDKVVTVAMLDVLRPAFEEWLHGRGLALQDITSNLGDDYAGLSAYVVVFPEGGRHDPRV